MSTAEMTPINPWSLIKSYVGNISMFGRMDWVRYISWMLTVGSLFVGVSVFFTVGVWSGVEWPGYVWFIPLGSFMFASALAIDDIGHRTLYKEQLGKGEGHVHQMIVITAVSSVVALCLCYQHGEVFGVPALALIVLSFFYSMIDEALHWHRYLKYGVDRVEMWSHFVAITGHVLMIFCWWHWYQQGFPGVDEFLMALGG